MTLFTKCVFEWLGTMVLILLGDGVCAGNSLNKTKGHGGGWVVITLAWGFAVMCGVFIAGPYSGAHLNPAVTLGLAIAGKFAVTSASLLSRSKHAAQKNILEISGAAKKT